jgi:hypothetical protein
MDAAVTERVMSRKRRLENIGMIALIGIRQSLR